ncbi:MAG TPA: glycosyltransferase family 9 protein [Rhodanobacteraceae bacterium]|nr:glycosyltransferase family 9 protein [Rhodanobacteraceae bacterium]
MSTTPPQSLCLLRTSALGDVTHVVPLVRTLRTAWPQARLTWIIGKLEDKLVGDIEGVEFIVFDKSSAWRGYRDVRRALRGRHFDALLHMQVALRANLLSSCVQADRRIGYDKARSKDLHGLFVNERIPARSGEHVLDAIGSFAEPLGLKQTQVRWDIPVPEEARDWAAQQWRDDERVLIISPCSSHALRNWRAERYAAVADYAAHALGLRVALCGGLSPRERAMGDAILADMKTRPLDLIGRDTLKRALALYQRAVAVLTPDAGPMHMANAVGAKVIGLHAASNAARSGPYSDRRWCVDRYDGAARKFLHKNASEIPWGTKIEYPGVMDLIGVGDVVERLEALVHAL